MTDTGRWMPLVTRLRLVHRAMLGLLLALVLVQTVGVLHRVAHAQQSANTSTPGAADATGGLAAIWGEHSTSAECQLFDQACPDLLHMTQGVWPMPLAESHWTAGVLADRFALFERFYAARGPPVWH